MGLEGRRTTSQRRLLLRLIGQAEGHLDADELYRRAREHDPRINLSTVYRNLRLFKDLGLVDERHFEEEHHHYEVKGTPEHCHLICLGCGGVIEFETSSIQRIKEEAAALNFQVSGAEFHLSGYCHQCREQR